MIKGIGVDIIEVDRIERAIAKNEKFLERIFSQQELLYIKSRGNNKCTISGLFSSKESVSKALGTGIRGFKWTDIEIAHDNLGKPKVNLRGNAKQIAVKKGINKISLSISHIAEKAIAISIAQGALDKDIDENIKDNEFKNILIKRNKHSHKGTYGRVGIIGGSKGMSGAPFLASSAALRTGSGLVYTMVPEIISQVLEIKSTEAIVQSFKDNGYGFSKEAIDDIIYHSKQLDVVALGPGLGLDKDRVVFVKALLKNLKLPIVLDADGLNCIVGDEKTLRDRKNPTVLTPHLREFSRLIDLDIAKIEIEKEKHIMEFARKHKIILVLKGHNTMVCDGKDIYINNTGNPGMATAGTGDVLTGIIASLLGQGIEAFNAAKLGVYLHGLAGDIVKREKGEQGLIASDIISSIPFAIKTVV